MDQIWGYTWMSYLAKCLPSSRHSQIYWPVRHSANPSCANWLPLWRFLPWLPATRENYAVQKASVQSVAKIQFGMKASSWQTKPWRFPSSFAFVPYWQIIFTATWQNEKTNPMLQVSLIYDPWPRCYLDPVSSHRYTKDLTGFMGLFSIGTTRVVATPCHRKTILSATFAPLHKLIFRNRQQKSQNTWVNFGRDYHSNLSLLAFEMWKNTLSTTDSFRFIHFWRGMGAQTRGELTISSLLNMSPLKKRSTLCPLRSWRVVQNQAI